MRAIGAVAAAAAVCVAALSGCTASPRAPAQVSLPVPGGMPGYYVVVAGRDVVMRASADGHVQAFAFGRIDNGAFTALPGTTPRVLPVSAAW